MIAPAPHIEVTDTPDPADRTRIAAALLGYNAGFLGPNDSRPLAVLLRDTDGTVTGGIWGRSAYRWLFIEMVFVPDARRGQGWGGRLLTTAEAAARDHDCIGIWLDTFSPDARRFYETRGYTVFGTIDDYPPGHTRWMLRKRLDDATG